MGGTRKNERYSRENDAGAAEEQAPPSKNIYVSSLFA